tara:strand:+ start:12829 stop:13971 length:1143 start_codon:yes stop_codon:yes gene_type:complete
MKNVYTLLVTIMFFSCGNSEKNKNTALDAETHSDEIFITQAQFEGENMAFGSLRTFDFNETIKANGSIDVPPHNKSSITTMVGGYISKTPLLIGDKVKKGQLLVTLKNTEYVEIQQNYLEISEQLNYLKSEYNRQKTLFDEKITSEKNYLKAESVYKSNLAHYNGLRKKLQMMNLNPTKIEEGNISSTINIYATIDGYVTKVNVSNGTYVSTSDVILEIVDTDHIHLELSVFEKDILKVKKDQKIIFTIPEASNETYDAEVHLVGTTIDEQSRRVKVHGHVAMDKANFIVGMFVDAEIITGQYKSISLPKDAVIATNDGHYALILEEKNETGFLLEKTKLDIGNETEDFVEILNPDVLKQRQIIVKGTSLLLNESEGHSH